MAGYSIPLLGFAAYSGTGKTTLLCKIIPILNAKGIRIGIVKHAHHNIEIDHPNKDSYTLREAGATKIIITSPKRTAIIIEHEEKQQEYTLEEAIKNIETKDLDLVLVEGFKFAYLPKIELHREALEKPYLYPNDTNIIALAVDHAVEDDHKLPQLDLNQPQQIADFIEEKILKTKL